MLMEGIERFQVTSHIQIRHTAAILVYSKEFVVKAIVVPMLSPLQKTNVPRLSAKPPLTKQK